MRAPLTSALAVVALTACARGSGGERLDTTDAALRPADTTGLPAQPPAATPPAPLTPGSGSGQAAAGSGSASGRATGQPGRTPAPPPSSPGSSGSSGGASSADTARGRVAVVGSVPVTQVVLRPTTGRAITLTGPLARELRAASGADVWVRGRRVDERTFEVTRYAVRTVDGVTAITGTLAADGDRLVLVDDDGRRHVVGNPPPSLRELVGARVWISGELSTGLTAYGILRRQ